MKTGNDLPSILVIFGASGDLVKRMTIPALWDLHKQKSLPARFRVIGFSRRPWTEKQFRSRVAASLPKTATKGEEVRSFLNLFSYHQGLFAEASAYLSLGQKIGLVDRQWQICANKLFYLAVPPRHDETILRLLAASGLTTPCGPEEGWTRVMVEKPFGKNLEDAQKLDRLLAKLFKEEQIYRVDHYLAKEMMQNILVFRFANNLLERAWSGEFIEKIEVKLLETIGVERRGSFYDGVGALRDVGQNHLLQMLALATMKNPGKLESEAIRRNRARVLSRLRKWDRASLRKNVWRGQYKDYRHEAGVDRDSKTETYFKIQTAIENAAWRDVPIILESGKRMAALQKEIVITFRHPTPCLFCSRESGHLQNQVVFRLSPQPGVEIQFWSKKPGADMELEGRKFTSDYADETSAGKPLKDYAKLLLDCMRGDQTLFVSSREALASWRFIDPIVKAWKQNLIPLEVYEAGFKV
jgi:glucose-6-phosphate 1-dehydrogenase